METMGGRIRDKTCMATCNVKSSTAQLSALPTKLEELKADENVQGQPPNFMGAPHGAPTHRPSWTSAFGRLLRWALSLSLSLSLSHQKAPNRASEIKKSFRVVNSSTFSNQGALLYI